MFNRTVLLQLQQRLLSLLNGACLMCYQASEYPVCRYCQEDTSFFSQEGIRGNVLRSPLIAEHVQHQSFHQLYACGFYHWPFDDLIRLMKFKSSMASVRVLADGFVQYARPHSTPLPEVLLPVPMSLMGLFKRQYNQSLLLAKALSRRLGIQVEANWAVRKGGATQHFLSRAERQANLTHAFVVNECPAWRHVAIVDDVVTTGSTVELLASLLRQQLPHVQIEVWAMAITKPIPDVNSNYFKCAD